MRRPYEGPLRSLVVEAVELFVDGTRLHGEFHAAAGGKAAVVLLHGFRSSLREFGDLPERLASAGIHALAIDHRGHGLSDGERGRVGLGRALADTEAAVAWLQARVAKRVRLGLVGHSLGASHAVGIASRTTFARALVLAHPVDRLLDELGPAERLVYHALGRLGQRRLRRGRAAGSVVRAPLYRHLLRDPEAQRRARETSLLQRSVNLGNYAYAVTMQASDWARRVEVPALCVFSPHDQVVHPLHTQTVFDNLRGERESLQHDGGHSCFLDLDADRVMAATAEFLRRRLAVRA